MSESIHPRERRTRSEAEKRELLSRQVASGKTIIEFCVESGVSPSCFHRWKREFSRINVESPIPAPSFLEIMSSAMPSLPPAASVRVVLSSGDSIETSTDCPPQWLASILRSLRMTPC